MSQKHLIFCSTGIVRTTDKYQASKQGKRAEVKLKMVQDSGILHFFWTILVYPFLSFFNYEAFFHLAMAAKD